MTDTATALANLERRKQLGHLVREWAEGMTCDLGPCCTRFAAFAVVTDADAGPDDLGSVPIDVLCDRHHVEDQPGFHVRLDPIDADLAALRARLGI